jgi:hypothetical protein
LSSGGTNAAMPDLLAWVMGAAELLLGDVLAGDRLHHVGAGDEHVEVSSTMKMKSVSAGL